MTDGEPNPPPPSPDEGYAETQTPNPPPPVPSHPAVEVLGFDAEDAYGADGNVEPGK